MDAGTSIAKLIRQLKMPSSKINSNELSRRALLKSAGVLVGSSALLSAVPAMAKKSTPSTLISNSQGKTLPITKPMVGFMLAHEQFPISELVKLGVAAEEAGFDLLATSDHLQPWQANERQPDKLG